MRPDRPRARNPRAYHCTCVDLTPTSDQEAFRAELRSWLADHLPDEALPHALRGPGRRGRRPPPLAGRAGRRPVGRRDLARGVRRPGRRARSHHFIVQEELARARAPELVGRIGINLVGPTLLAHGTPEQKARWLPADPGGRRAVVPALQRARRRQRPRGGGDQGRAGRRRLDAHGQKVWTSYAQFADWGLCLARTDPDAPKNQGISAFAVDMRAAGVEVRPLRADHRRGRVQRGLLRRRLRPRRPPDRRRERRVAGLQLDPDPRAGHQPPPARDPRPAPRGAVAAGHRVRRATTTPGCSGSWPRPSSRCASSSSTTGARCPAWPPARSSGPEGSTLKLYWSEMSKRLHETVMAVLGAGRAAVAGGRRTTRATASGSGRGSTTRPPRSSPGRTRSSATSSASGCWACPGSPDRHERAAASVARAARRRSRRERGTMTGPLAGLRVLDLGTRIAAPFCAGLLGEQGAEVIKIEQPGTGDFMREIGPFVDRRRAVLAVLGRRGPRPQERHARPAPSPRARTLFRRLAATADVVVENFRPGTLEQWNIAPDDLDPTGWSPCASPSSARTGPTRTRPGLDRVGIGYGGLLHLTGYPDRPPVRVGVTISDYLTGVFAAQAAIAALYARDATGTGRGAVIDAALYGAALRILEWTLAGLRPARHGAHARGQPARQLGAARQLPDRRRQVRVHRRRLRRQLRPPVQGDGPARPARRPALRHAAPTGPAGATRSTASSPSGRRR